MNPLESFYAAVYSLGLVTLGIMVAIIAWFVFSALVLVAEKIYMWLDILFSRKG